MSQKRSRREYEADLQRLQSPFVICGTPLPPLDENTRDDGSYVPLWKQEVTDDHGRKRLHGAFTGGFSAGYFNSVGSKEGWTPSTFVSSRSNRAKDAKNSQQQQKVEDFMDAEDLREREESRQISTADGFAGFAAHDDHDRHALDDIFKPVKDSMGEKLLIKMGWKKGQGIGPRVLRKIDLNDETSAIKEFPPEDSPMLDFPQKQDVRGLGSTDEELLLERNIPRSGAMLSTAEEAWNESKSAVSNLLSPPVAKTKKSFRSSGIRVGSLNDTGSDDEDPYEMGPRVAYNRVLGGEKKAKKSKNSSTNANPLLQSTPKFISRRLPTALTTLQKCHDGKLPLTGFILADANGLINFGSMNLSDEKCRPPEVPEGWQPMGLVDTSDATTWNSQNVLKQPTLIHQQQTAQSRANILREAPLPSKSIFDFLSPAARDRLAAASRRPDLPPALNEAPPTSILDPTAASGDGTPRITYPELDSTTATIALNRLRKDKDKPYAEDLTKQGRYKDFLRFSSDPKPIAERIPPLRAPTHKTDNEHLAELHEFTTTANLFRPATGFLASRFTSAASASTLASVSESDTAPNEADGSTTRNANDELLRKPTEKPKDPAEEAAKLGMFGVATRTTTGFYPTKLVCKRFGVDMPTE